MNIDTFNNKFSKIQFTMFREDVLDCFHSIIKSIEDDKIQTKYNYNEIMHELLNDFKLINIIKFINDLSSDDEFRKHKKTYNVALTYCNEIMENDIIKKLLSNKEKVE